MTTNSINLSLDLKYRPKTLTDMVGNKSTVESIQSLLNRKQGPPKSFLFIGPSGCGKTTFAMIIRNLLKVSEQDTFIYNTANTRGIDTIRKLEATCKYAPMHGTKKFYLLDECHMLTKEAQNALLLLLEDPPKHVYFVLCTTNSEKVLETIKTRCSTYTVSSLPRNKIMLLLKKVVKEEGIEPPLPDRNLNEIAYCSGGSCRKALKILEQVIEIADDERAFKMIQDTSIGEATVLEICKMLVEPGKGKWAEMSKLIKGVDSDTESIRYAILGYLSAVLLNSPEGNPRIAEMMSIFVEPCMYTGKGGIVLEIYLACQL